MSQRDEVRMSDVKNISENNKILCLEKNLYIFCQVERNIFRCQYSYSFDMLTMMILIALRKKGRCDTYAKAHCDTQKVEAQQGWQSKQMTLKMYLMICYCLWKNKFC